MKKHSSNWQKCICPVPGCTNSYGEIKNWRKHFRLKHIDKNDDDTAREKSMKTFEQRIIMADSAPSNALHPHDEFDESLSPKTTVKEVSSIAPVANRANRSLKKKDLQIENARLSLIIRKLLRIKMSKRLVNLAIHPKRLTYKTIGLEIVPVEPVEPVTRKCPKIPEVPPSPNESINPIFPNRK